MTELSAEPLVDTNILVYAFDKSEQRKHSVAKEILRKCWAGETKLSVSLQNINEFCHVASKKIANPLSAEDILKIADLITGSDNFVLLNIDSNTIRKALSIYAEHKSPAYWDCLLAATMKQNEISIIYTENEKDFEKIAGIKPVNPFR